MEFQHSPSLIPATCNLKTSTHRSYRPKPSERKGKREIKNNTGNYFILDQRCRQIRLSCVTSSHVYAVVSTRNRFAFDIPWFFHGIVIHTSSCPNLPLVEGLLSLLNIFVNSSGSMYWQYIRLLLPFTFPSAQFLR